MHPSTLHRLPSPCRLSCNYKKSIPKDSVDLSSFLSAQVHITFDKERVVIMGAAISALRDEIKEADARAEEKAKQDLEILQKMVDAQLDKYESEMTQ